MTQDAKVTKKKLDDIWGASDGTILKTKGEKYALISDLHLGDGKKADNFVHNEKILEAALKKYRSEKYKMILLGDIEEFWQFDLEKISERYNKSIYKALKDFGKGEHDNNVHRLFGNHDIEWRSLKDPSKNKPIPVVNALEAIKLRDVKGRLKILLVHGHQGSKESDKTSWFSRFFVRLYKPIESAANWLGLLKERSATKSQVMKDYEKIYYTWAKENKVIVICGHSHRAIFASRTYIDYLKQKVSDLQREILSNPNDKKLIRNNIKSIEKFTREMKDEESKNRDLKFDKAKQKKPCYFNTGCGLFDTGVTAIEIEDDEIRLVKWEKGGKKNPEFDFNKGSLSQFIDEL